MIPRDLKGSPDIPSRTVSLAVPNLVLPPVVVAGLVPVPSSCDEARGGKDHAYRGNCWGQTNEGTAATRKPASGVEFDRSVSGGSLHRNSWWLRGDRERPQERYRAGSFPG